MFIYYYIGITLPTAKAIPSKKEIVELIPLFRSDSGVYVLPHF